MSRAFLRALPLAAVGALGAVLFLRNRGGFADPLVDFGRELYLPWRILAGDLPYRDVAYLDGPFAPWWNALWFCVAGTGLATLEWANLAAVAAAAALFHAILRRLGGPLAAWTGVAFFLCVFAFNLIGRGGNMNWIAPYSHGITHGIVWALAALWLLARHLETRRPAELAGAGLALGLALLTKPEVAIAGVAGVGVGLATGEALRPSAERQAAPAPPRLAGRGAGPVLRARALLALAMPFATAAAGVLGGWTHLAGSDVGGLEFYRWVMGLDRPERSLRLMARQLFLWALVLGPGLALALALRTPGRTRVAVATAVGLALLALTGPSWLTLDWGEFLRPLTPVAAAIAAWAAWRAWRTRREPEPDVARAALRLAVATFALALLGKVLLQPVLWGYAFALAAPATLLVVLVLVDAVPAFVARRGGFAWAFRGLALALLAIAAVGCLRQSEGMRRAKTVVIGRGADRMVADARLGASKLVARLVPWVERELPPGDSLLVMPEGILVNYLTRRPNPTRHLNFVPPEVVVFGEAAMLADLRAAPPDRVVLVHRDTREYRLPLFGIDYGRRLRDWVHAEYELRARVGAAPLRPDRLVDGRTGFEVWTRRRAR